MYRRTFPYLAVGVALLLSNSASALTIINTDSHAGQSVSEARPETVQSANSTSVAPKPASPSQRSMPPLPEGKASVTSSNEEVEADRMSQRASEAGYWLTPDGPEPRVVPTPSISTTAVVDTSTSTTVPNDVVEKAVSDQAVSSRSSTANKASASVASTKSYRIDEGWLSEAIEKLADQAGYEMKWSLGENDSADFHIHRDFSLSATDAREALSQVVEPFPIRLCLYQTDRIAQVIAADSQCQ